MKCPYGCGGELKKGRNPRGKETLKCDNPDCKFFGVSKRKAEAEAAQGNKEPQAPAAPAPTAHSGGKHARTRAAAGNARKERIRKSAESLRRKHERENQPVKPYNPDGPKGWFDRLFS